MASILPADVINEIFQYLEDDTNTLYSGLSVNKLWCHVIVPLLWRDPWEIARSRRTYEAYYFLCVLCGCLPEDSKNLLLDLGLVFQIQYPKFDYASYIRVINSRYFNDSIARRFRLGEENNFKRQLLEKELYLLIISHSPAIKRFSINCTLALEHPLLNFSGAHASFSKLNEININTKILPQSFLINLANISKNIQQIHIINFNVDEDGLAKLIEAQSGITHLHLESGEKCDGLKINKELEAHSHSLKHFIMESPHLIPATSLRSCVWIETLKLDTKDLERDDVDFAITLYESLMSSLAVAEFPHLRNLHLRVIGYCPVSVLKAAENLVVRSRGQLRSLFLYGTFKKEQAKPTLLQSIAKHCPKLDHLSIWITNNDDDVKYLEQLLSSCPLLKGIIINTLSDIRINGDELLRLFMRRLSRKLCKFKFDDGLTFSYVPFAAFMDCWNIMDPLQIHVIDASIFSFDYEVACHPFSQRGSLKCFIEADEFTDFSWDSAEGDDLLEEYDSSDTDETEDSDEDEDEENINDTSEDRSEESNSDPEELGWA